MPVNPTPPGLGQRILDLERRIRALETSPALNAASISGSVTIAAPGGLYMIGTTGSIKTVAIGQRNTVDGPEMATQFYRDDGTIAFAIADFGSVPGHVHVQSLQWFDRHGRVILCDDATSGRGLARPHIELGSLSNTNVNTWPNTASTGFTTIANGYMELQNPRLTWQIQVFAATGCTAEYRMIVNGVQCGSVKTCAANSFDFWSTTVSLPAGSNVGDVPLIELQARVSSGTGVVYGQVQRLAGWES